MKAPRMLLGAAFLLAGLASAAAHAADANPADAVLQRYIDASGGAAKLAAVHSRVMDYTMKAGWLKLDAKTTLLWPDKILVESRVPVVGTHISNGYDGSTAWVSEGVSGVRRLQGRELQEFILGQRLDRMSRLFELYPKRTLLPAKAGAGANAAPQVEVGTQFGTSETWTFDPASGLLQASEGVHDGGPKKGLVHIVTTFEDYRTVDGLTLPFHATMHTDDDKGAIVLNGVQNNVPVEASAFTPPPDLAPAAPASPH